jgi:D-alanine-D-alanine ligase
MPDHLRRTKPNVLVVLNENPAWPEVDLAWSHAMNSTLFGGLREQGYTFKPFQYFDDLSGLDRYDPAEWLVWNWGEELAGVPWSEARVAAELERRDFFYTGSPPAVFQTIQNRPHVKQILEAAGLPTLPSRVFADPAEAVEWKLYPAIVKGANQHASYGIGRDSVVTAASELARRIAFLRAEYADEALVEPFLDSREFHVAVWGNGTPEALPPVEYDYSNFGDIRDRLYTYESKFDQTSRGFKEIKTPCPAPADRPDWQARLMEVAVKAYRALGLRDYGRIDLRMLGDEPQILDANANPDLDVTSVLPISARALGLSYGGMVDRILGFAAERMPGRHRRPVVRQPQVRVTRAAGGV